MMKTKTKPISSDSETTDGIKKIIQSDCAETPLLEMTQNSLANSDWKDVFLNHRAMLHETKNTVVRVGDDERTIANQENSGTCWIHATVASYREMFLNNSSKIDPEHLRFSVGYILYYHLLESAAAFLQKIYKYKDKPHTDPINMCILSNILSEGGSGNTGYRLVKRYGIVPYNSMPSTEQTYNPASLVEHLIKILKIGATRIRAGEDYKKITNQCLQIIKKFLCVSLGTPPKKISYAFPMKTDGKFFVVPEISPLGFYRKYLKPFDSVNLYILINTRHPEHKWVATKDFESTTDTTLEDTAEFVVSPSDFETTLRNSIQKKYAIFIGIDVEADINTDQGWGETNLYDPDIILSDDEKEFMGLDRKKLLANDMLSSNHAVLIVGYGTEDNKPTGIITHWLIENSWGDDSGDEGYLRVSREWLLENAYGACIQKRFLPRGVYQSPTKENMIIIECYEGRGKLL